MKVSIDILQERDGRFVQEHSVINDDSATYSYAGSVEVVETAGQKIHSGDFDDMEALVVINTGEAAFKVRFNTESTPASATTDVTVNPTEFILIPAPEHATGKVVTLYALAAGDEGVAQFWISGT